MPGFIVHLGATVMCMHGGQAQPTAPFPRVMVSNQPVVTQAAPFVVAGCALTGTPSPPCVTAQWTTGATRVMAGGIPVLLQDSIAVCAASGTGVNIVVTQVRVKAQ
jgi:hypothetical protein